MRRPLEALSTEEKTEVLGALDNSNLVIALRKILASEEEDWAQRLRSESGSPAPNTNLMIQYGARAREAGDIERVIRKAVGL